jgi:hypothetical protein
LLIDSKTSRRLCKFLKCLQMIANDLLTIYISVSHTATLQPRTILESKWRLCKNVKISRVKLNAGNPRDVNATLLKKVCHFPVPSRNLTKLIPAGDGKIFNLFLRCIANPPKFGRQKLSNSQFFDSHRSKTVGRFLILYKWA